MILEQFNVRPKYSISHFADGGTIVEKINSDVEIRVENCTDEEVAQLIEQFIKLKKETA